MPVVTHGSCNEQREVARAAAYVKHALARLNANGGGKGLKGSPPAAEEEELGEEVIKARRAQGVAPRRSGVRGAVGQRVHQAFILCEAAGQRNE